MRCLKAHTFDARLREFSPPIGHRVLERILYSCRRQRHGSLFGAVTNRCSMPSIVARRRSEVETFSKTLTVIAITLTARAMTNAGRVAIALSVQKLDPRDGHQVVLGHRVLRRGGP